MAKKKPRTRRRADRAPARKASKTPARKPARDRKPSSKTGRRSSTPAPTPPDAPVTPSPDGDDGYNRDDKGRFGPGNKGGTFPYAENQAAIRARLHALLTPDRVEKLILAAMTSGEEGDWRATSMLLDRVLGKATQPHEVKVEEAPPLDVDSLAQTVIDNDYPEELFPWQVRDRVKELREAAT